MALTVGIDVVDVERIKKAAESGVSLTDLFTPGEIKACTSKRRAHARLATCFAVKEAFLKASGLGLHSGLLFKDIEVVNRGRGATELQLSERVRQLSGVADPTTCLVSSAFTDTLACAAVALRKRGIE